MKGWWWNRQRALTEPVPPPIAPEPESYEEAYLRAANDVADRVFRALDAQAALGRAKTNGSWDEWLSASARAIEAKRGTGA